MGNINHFINTMLYIQLNNTDMKNETLKASPELTTYPTITTMDELKQQVDVLVASGRGSYSVGITLTVDDNSKTICTNELPTIV
jgi:hypothetical protein